jgi:ferric-dicitrate binding protein FerR (iron transport regulator)
MRMLTRAYPKRLEMSKRGIALAISILTVFSQLAVAVFSQATQISGKVTLKQADGSVMVNGQPAVANSNIASDSTVTTAARSSAVVSLGKLGRVEVTPNTSLKLSYSDTGTTAMLDQGRIRVSSSSGVSATVKTHDAEIVTIPKRANEFTVDVTCGDTLVAVQKGSVELRAGNTVKQIAAGGQDTAGQATPGCKR